jgi:hypothetical protein
MNRYQDPWPDDKAKVHRAEGLLTVDPSSF